MLDLIFISLKSTKPTFRLPRGSVHVGNDLSAIRQRYYFTIFGESCK